jgi:uncharacterized SAM-dependent methyltransferase
MTGFDEIIQGEVFRKLRWMISSTDVATYTEETLRRQLVDKGNLLTSAAWYCDSRQALQFARMTFVEGESENTNREIQLLNDILAANPFEDISGRDCVSVVDLGCGNGQKAAKILAGINANRVNYFAVDTSPYMGLVAYSYLWRKFTEKVLPQEVMFATVFPHSGIEGSSNACLEELVGLIEGHYARISKVVNAWHSLLRGENFNRFIESKEREWDCLCDKDKEKALVAERAEEEYRYNARCDIESRVQEMSEHERDGFHRRMMDRHFPLTWPSLKKQLELINLYLTKSHEANRNFKRVWFEENPLQVLQSYKDRALRCSDLRDDVSLLRLHRVLDSWPVKVWSPDAAGEMEALGEEISLGNCDSVRQRLYFVEQRLMYLTFLRPTGWFVLEHLPVAGKSQEVLRWRNYPLVGDVSEEVHYKSELQLNWVLSTKYCDFLNGDLLRLFSAIQYQDCLSFSRKIVALLGQTLGNFDLEERRRIVSNVSASLNSGDYFMIGAELRPSNDDPNKDRKIAEMEKYYGDPDLNGGVEGEGSKFLRHSLRAVDVRDDHVAYRAIFNRGENRMEMFFDVKYPFSVGYEGKTRSFNPGDRILGATSYKFTVSELEGLLTSSGFDVVLSPDRYSYTVIVARKK